jgi:hypothetical protein
MFRLFRRPVRQAARRRPGYRPTVENLEGRDLLSVSVLTFTDPTSGAAGLRVIANGNDTVTITDDSTHGKTTVVADGQTQSFNQQFRLFDLQLEGHKDSLEFDLAGTEMARKANIHVDLGKGENHFTFNPGETPITAGSDVRLNLTGHNGNDFVNASFGNILESRVSLTASNLGGSKTALSPDAVRDVITFGDRRAGIRNSSVDVNIGFGTGNNNLTFNYGSDLGHLASGGADQPGDFGPSTFNVNITDSNRHQDTDNVTLFANGEVNTGSVLNFNTSLGAGNNSFKTVIDAANFQIDDDGGVFSPGPTPGTFAPHSGGAAHFNVQAGTGNDTISFQSINQEHTIELSGTFDINILGSSGKDNINVNFGGQGGFTDDDPFEKVATNRKFRLRIDGGSGNDTITVNLSNANTATFDYDIAIQGGTGKNDITFGGANAAEGNPSGSPTFGPSGVVSIDGGPGGPNHAAVFGNFPVDVQNAV